MQNERGTAAGGVNIWSALTKLAALMLVAACSLAPARAELPLEQLSTTALPVPNSHRLYLSDPSLGHIVDGRIHVIDGEKMRYLGLIGAGFAAATALSNDGQTLFLATTYHSRLQRGIRTDVVEAYNTADLRLKYEIEVPPRRAQGLNIKALLRQTRDGRFHWCRTLRRPQRSPWWTCNHTR